MLSPTSTQLLKNQIQHLLNDSRTDTIFMPAAFGNANEGIEWLEELKASKTIKHISAANAVKGQFIHLADKRELIAHSQASSDSVKPSKITYTSGSTGTPKGVCLGEDTIDSITQSLSNALAPRKLGRHLCLIPFAALLENPALLKVLHACSEDLEVLLRLTGSLPRAPLTCA